MGVFGAKSAWYKMDDSDVVQVCVCVCVCVWVGEWVGGWVGGWVCLARNVHGIKWMTVMSCRCVCVYVCGWVCVCVCVCVCGCVWHEKCRV